MSVTKMKLSDMERINLSYMRHLQREKFDQRVILDFRAQSLIKIKLNSKGNWSAYTSSSMGFRTYA